jgi:hypothetical protein
MLQARTACGIQGGRRRPQAAHPAGVKGSGMAGPGGTLGSSWIPFAIPACYALKTKRKCQKQRLDFCVVFNELSIMNY